MNIERPTLNIEWQKMKKVDYDIRRSSVKTTHYGVTGSCECLPQKLAPMA
jgi:hypothetical protein